MNINNQYSPVIKAIIQDTYISNVQLLIENVQCFTPKLSKTELIQLQFFGSTQQIILMGRCSIQCMNQFNVQN